LTTGDNSVPGEDKLQWVEETRDEIEAMQAETEICASVPLACRSRLPVRAKQSAVWAASLIQSSAV